MSEDQSEQEMMIAIAKAGVAGMYKAHKGETISPDLMVTAALHVLAAWAAGAGADPDQIAPLLREYIDKHREWAWIPPPDRVN